MPTSAADVAFVNPKGMGKLLASSLITFFIHGKPTLMNGRRILSWYPLNCTILDIYLFIYFLKDFC